MGKKVKKRRGLHKEKRVSNLSPPKQSSNQVGASVNESGVLKDRKLCAHFEEGVDLPKLSAKITALDAIKCEDCREVTSDRRGGKGKAKHGKKKESDIVEAKSESKAIWVCLKCGHYACGGVGFPTTPQTHARRHSKQSRHPLAVQFHNPQLRWCFSCDNIIPIQKSAESDGLKDVFRDVVKLIKTRSVEGSSVNAEDNWFGGGSAKSEMLSGSGMSVGFDGRGGYAVRGLVNLGNTCFFNSVMQNLLAMDKLRDYFLKLEGSVGPLTAALKKVFADTSFEGGTGNVVNPKSFFGQLCSKAPQFRGYEQQDSHELLRYLLEGICSEELSARDINSLKNNRVSSGEVSTFVDTIFGGQVSSTVCCAECGHSSTVYEPFLDLSLSMPSKKPPSRKAQVVARGKKMKLPPKKAGKLRSKAAKDMGPVSGQNSSKPATTGDSFQQVVPAECVAENMVTSASDFTWLDFIEPRALADDGGSVSQSISLAQESGNGQTIEFVEEETSSLKNESTRLNYVEEGVASDAWDINPKDNDLTGAQVPGKEGIAQDGSLVEDFSVANRDFLSHAEELNDKSDFTSNPAVIEVPLQVKASEVLLLPYKEDASATNAPVREGEASSMVAPQEQDLMDFDGFGGIFDEPEIALDPIKRPSLGDKFGENGNLETGLLPGSFSETDPDEIDNTDSPVSIESCLAHFTKPELLSYKHGWHCENCSKSRRDQRMKARSRAKGLSKTLLNGDEAGTCDKDLSCPIQVKKDGNENTRIDDTLNTNDEGNDLNKKCMKYECNQVGGANLIATHLEAHDEMKDAVSGLSPSECYKTCNLFFSTPQGDDSCSIYEQSFAKCDATNNHLRHSSLVAGNCGSEESEDETVDSASVKVKRDATKRFLINKAPLILTIHLKRFGQDARGRLSKLNGHVDFRERLVLRPYMDPRRIEGEEYEYRLVGVVEHSGTMKGGHYVAYVRGHERKKDMVGFAWYYVSDAMVRRVSLEEVLQCDAYLLFYEKI